MRIGTWKTVLLLCLAMGCNDTSVTPRTGFQYDMGIPNQPGGRQLTIICGDQSENPTCDARNAEVFALTNQTLQLRVAYDVNNMPLPSQSITFKLLTGNGVATPNNSVDMSSLISQAVQTDASGVATAQVSIGSIETNFIVEASAVQATPVRWRISVGNAGVGAFSVRVLYSTTQGRYSFGELSKADVFLFNRRNSSQTCANLMRNPTDIRNADGSLTIGNNNNPFNEVDNIGIITGLQADSQYTVAALLYGPSNAAVGFGCVDDERVVGGRTTRVDVNVTDLPNNFKGIYNALHRFDLRRALETSPEPSLQSLNDFLDVLYLVGGNDDQRATALRRLICDFDDTICNTLAGLGASLVGGIVEEIVLADNPELLNTLRGLSELVGMLEDLRVLGKIEFYTAYAVPETDTDVTRQMIRENETRWEKLRLTWRGMQRDFTLGDLTSNAPDVDGRVRVISALFDGELVGSNLEIEDHNLQINWGLILLGIAEYWILPEIVNLQAPVRIEEVLSELLPCQRIDDLIRNQGFCRDNLAPALAAVIRSEISDFRLSADGIDFNGTTVPVDDDGDLAVDRLTNGVWEGTFSETNRFFGCFNACKCLDAVCSCQAPDCTVPTSRPPRQ